MGRAPGGKNVEFSIASVPGGPARSLPVRQRTRYPSRPAIRARLLSDVFDVIPAGILVVSELRHLLAWNPAVAEIVGDRVESATTCCEVFGCNEPGGPLADVCLTELVLAGGARLNDIVVNVRGSNGNGVLVEATPFTRGSNRTVVYEIRPASGPPQPSPSPGSGSTIYIRTLGETVLETDRGEIRGDWLDQRAGRLLKFLIAHRYRPVHADTIAEELWPRARADTTNTVRHFVHALREKLEPNRAPYERSAFVLARNGGYLLNPERVTVDADEFEREVRAGLIALAANESDTAAERLRHALDLYHGDFLPDERFEDWAIVERERLRDLVGKPLRALGGLTDDPDEATTYLERLASMEPLDVEIHRDLIRAWLGQGRRGRAMRHYRVLQSRLMRELGERLSPDLAEFVRTRPEL
jgi:DNA-binding SARP family transcriptional activator